MDSAVFNSRDLLVRREDECQDGTGPCSFTGVVWARPECLMGGRKVRHGLLYILIPAAFDRPARAGGTNAGRRASQVAAGEGRNAEQDCSLAVYRDRREYPASRIYQSSFNRYHRLSTHRGSSSTWQSILRQFHLILCMNPSWTSLIPNTWPSTISTSSISNRCTTSQWQLPELAVSATLEYGVKERDGA